MILRLSAFNPEGMAHPDMGIRFRFRDTGNWYDPSTGLEVPENVPPLPTKMDRPGDAAGLERWLDVSTDHPTFRGQYRHLLAYYFVLKEDGQPNGSPIDYQSHHLWDGREVASQTFSRVAF